MKHLIIRHFGPIKEVDVELKRVNLIIGPQSSGKSCVLKIASFCDWIERQIQQSQNPDIYCSVSTVSKSLITFHKLVGYLHPDSFFSYETDTIYFQYSAKDKKCCFRWKDKRWTYKRAKIAYIPAERNLVAAIPNWFQVSMNNDNILDFMKEWEFARKSFVTAKPVLDLAVKYKYNKSRQSDQILLDDGAELDFTMTSSGLQSLIPLFLMTTYLTSGYYKDPSLTVEQDILRSELQAILMREFPNQPIQKQSYIIYSILKTHHTDLFIEEPEAHIFPSTQKHFVYSLAGMLNSNRRKHNCFLTTHSPYIMTSFNNLIFAGEISAISKENSEKVGKVIPAGQRLRLSEVAAFEMSEGKMTSIIDTETGLISAESLDSASQEIGSDFDYLLGI